MVALFSPLFPNMGWSIDDYISHEQFGTDLYRNADETSPDAAAAPHLVSLPSTPLPAGIMERCDSLKFDGGSTNIGSGGGGGDAAGGMVKKLSHNASERDRRKRMNGLFSSLRSLLPASDQKTRMSIPTTISRVVKYIPELRKELERLQKKKQELTSRVNSWQKFSSSSSPEFNKRRRVVGGHHHHHHQSYLSASQVGERDIVIQICSKKGNKNLFADALSCLEQEGLDLLDSSTFQTSEDRVNFYTLHLQVQGTEVMEVDKLKEKLLSYFNEEQQLLP